MIIVFFFLFGILFGSFLNVCITRIPEEISIVSPGSRCPQCGTPIKPYDNVPVFAWMWLRGKCRACGTPISVMYPLIELTTGLLFVAAFVEFGITQTTVKWLFFTCLVIILTVTDLRVRLLPDVVTWPGFAAGLLFSAFVPPDRGFGGFLAWRLLHMRLPAFAGGLLDGILGAAFGSFLLWGLASALQSGAWARRHGNGRRENDGHGGGIPWIAGDVLDAVGREFAGECNWTHAGAGVVCGWMEDWIGEAGQPARAGDGKQFAVGDC